MTHNVGTTERWLRALVGIAMASLAFVLPLPPLVRIAGFGAMGVYLVGTALAGSCLGYRLLGRSTCSRAS